jgi:hypothetical protein
MMRAAIPTTKHRSKIDRREPHILYSIQETYGVHKIQVGRISWTGSSRARLELRPRVQDGLAEIVIDARLHLAARQREMSIFPRGGATLNQMAEALGASLKRHGVPVMVKRGNTPLTEEKKTLQQHQHNGTTTPSDADEWALAVLISEGVQEVNALTKQIDSLTVKRDEIKAGTLNTLRQLLNAKDS